MINFIILIAKYCIFASKFKMQRPNVDGFLKTFHQRKEAESLASRQNRTTIIRIIGILWKFRKDISKTPTASSLRLDQLIEDCD